MPTPPCWLPHLGGQKGKDALILTMFIFHLAASALRIQGASHLLVTVSGEWLFFFFSILFFVIIFVCFATGNMDVLAVGKENP